MDTKQMTTMIVGLVIAVVMVAGFMIPIISSVGDGDETVYTNKGDYYFIELKEGDVYDLYYSDGQFSYEDPSENPDTIRWPASNIAFVGPWRIYSTYASVYHVEGTTVTYTDSSTNTIQTYTGAGLITTYPDNPDATHTTTRMNDVPYEPYVGDGSENFGCFVNEYSTDVLWDFLAWGNGSGLDFTAYAYPNTVIEGTDAIPTIEDGLLKGVTFTINGDTYFGDLLDEEPDTSYADFYVPIRIVEQGESLSPMIATLLSVIPLITVVGIVIGAIGFLRMKTQ